MVSLGVRVSLDQFPVPRDSVLLTAIFTKSTIVLPFFFPTVEGELDHLLGCILSRSRERGRLAGRKHPVRYMKTVLHYMGEEARYLEEKKARIGGFRILE